MKQLNTPLNTEDGTKQPNERENKNMYEYM